MKLKLTPFDALIVVDVQRDFMPGGALPVPEGDKVVAPLNQYIERFSKANLPVFFTRDWHPKDHISFKGHGGIWPPHCVQDTEGAQFHPDLKIPSDNKFIISKGTSRDFDAYSGFQGTILDNLLRERDKKDICGWRSHRLLREKHGPWWYKFGLLCLLANGCHKGRGCETRRFSPSYRGDAKGWCSCYNIRGYDLTNDLKLFSIYKEGDGVLL
jgi:hypothetical protein